MDKLKFYQVAALGMLLLNLGLLAMLVFFPRAERHGRPNDPLNLGEQQHAAFLELVDAHRAGMREIVGEQRGVLREYFDGLTAADAAHRKQVPARVLELEEEKIAGTYEHLLSVKALLRPEQVDRYPDFVRQAMQRILLESNRPGPKKKPRQ